MLFGYIVVLLKKYYTRRMLRNTKLEEVEMGQPLGRFSVFSCKSVSN